MTVRGRPGGIDISVGPDGMLVRIKEKTQRLENGCWVWTGRLNRDGYAEFTHRGVLESIHRYSYRLFVGPIPDGWEVDHLCNNRACLEPTHLEAVTQAENKRRTAERRTTCRSGRHPWTPENIYHHGGDRKCKPCHLEVVARYQARKKEKTR